MNKTKTIVTLVIVAILICGGGFLLYYSRSNKNPTPTAILGAKDYKDATYSIEGVPVTLVNGQAVTSLSGSASQTITKYFGNEVMGDLNAGDNSDVAFILTQNSGGSGTFYYVVVALATTTGSSDSLRYFGTNAVLLGDRIAPQTIEIKNGQLIVNYADRAVGDPMTAQPSVGVSKYFKITAGNLVDISSSVLTGDHSNIIKVTSPTKNQTISSPVTITGQAKGQWYFEATFPISIVDSAGVVIGQGPAQAQSDWMTNNFVPFKAVITFDKTKISNIASKNGTIILKKDNPSGLPEHDDSIEIPIQFK